MPSSAAPTPGPPLHDRPFMGRPLTGTVPLVHKIHREAIPIARGHLTLSSKLAPPTPPFEEDDFDLDKMLSIIKLREQKMNERVGKTKTKGTQAEKRDNQIRAGLAAQRKTILMSQGLADVAPVGAEDTHDVRSLIDSRTALADITSESPVVVQLSTVIMATPAVTSKKPQKPPKSESKLTDEQLEKLTDVFFEILSEYESDASLKKLAALGEWMGQTPANSVNKREAICKAVLNAKSAFARCVPEIMRQCLRVKYRVAQLKWRFEDEDHRYDPGALATTINDWNDEKDRRRAEIEGKSANGDEKKQVLLSIPAIEEGRAIPTGETHDAPALSVPLPSEARASSVPTAIDTRTSTLPPPIDNPTSTLPPPINAPAFSVPPPTDAPASIVPLPTVDDAGNVAPAGSTDPDKKAAEPDITPPGMGVAAGNVLPNAETTVTDTPPVASPENTDSVNVGHKEEHAPDVPEGQDPYEGQDDAEMEDVPPSKPGYETRSSTAAAAADAKKRKEGPATKLMGPPKKMRKTPAEVKEEFCKRAWEAGAPDPFAQPAAFIQWNNERNHAVQVGHEEVKRLAVQQVDLGKNVIKVAAEHAAMVQKFTNLGEAWAAHMALVNEPEKLE